MNLTWGLFGVSSEEWRALCGSILMRMRGRGLCAGLESKKKKKILQALTQKPQMSIYILGDSCQANPVCFENSPGEL